MTDTTAQDAHVSDTDDAQDATSQDTAQASAQDATPTGFDALPKETQDEIRALRREAAKYRTQIKQFEDAQKTDLERLTSERDEFKTRAETLEAQYRDARAESAFVSAATAANARDAETLFLAYKGRLEFDDEGNVTNVDAVLTDLKEKKPGLFAGPMQGRGDGGKQGPAPDTTDVNALIRAKWRGQQ